MFENYEIRRIEKENPKLSKANENNIYEKKLHTVYINIWVYIYI